MIDQQDFKPTDLDYLIGNHHLQMMKAALPYMNVSEQKLISLFVKMNELNRTIALFQDEEVAATGISSAEHKPTSPIDMLNAIKPFATTYEQDFIDLISNFVQGSKIFHSYQSTMDQEAVPQSEIPPAKNPLDQLRNFLPQEQQSRLETMQLMMQTMRGLT